MISHKLYSLYCFVILDCSYKCPRYNTITFVTHPTSTVWSTGWIIEVADILLESWQRTSYSKQMVLTQVAHALHISFFCLSMGKFINQKTKYFIHELQISGMRTCVIYPSLTWQANFEREE